MNHDEIIPLSAAPRTSKPSNAAQMPPDDDHLPAAYRAIDPATRGAMIEQQPRCVFIEVTNHCNLLCEMCPRTFVTYEDPKTLSWENFLRIDAQFPDMERAVLHGIGEPLLNKDLPRMIAHLKARGVYVLFNTNGTLLNEEWANLLIDSGLDELRCSIDGAEPRTYAVIRGAPLLHKIVKNLTAFMAIQRQRQASTPRVSVWMTGMKENVAELPALVRLSAQMGVPEVYLQRMVYYNDDDTQTAPGLLKAGHGLFDNFDQQVEALITEAEAIAAQHQISFRSSGATSPSKSLEASRTTTADQHPWQACLRPWTTAYITANGNALPCCISPFATNDYDSLKLGNLFDKPFSEIWNNADYQDFRKKLLSETPHQACAGCGVHWSL
jgi:MoaA/NifB/PqqE/SkfB family radical SAM enzyme